MAATQTTKPRPKRKKSTETETVTETPAVTLTKAEQAAAHVAELDALLDEIDEVLEENAEAFVAAYVQRGGE